MLQHPKNLFVALCVALLLLLNAITFIVVEGEYVILTVLGKATEKQYEPGLYFKWPWPFSQVHQVDARFHLYQSLDEQVLTKDQNSLIVRSHVIWKVEKNKTKMFWQKVKSKDGFEKVLQDLVRSNQNALFGNRGFRELYRDQGKESGLYDIENELESKLNQICEQYGVEISKVGIDKVSLPASVLENVYAKMNAERNRVSQTLKSEGEAEAKKIKAKAQSEYDQAIAKIEGQVKEILGKAEADSAESYRILAKHPELSLKLKKIESLESLLKDRSTIVIDSNVSPLDILMSTPR